MLQCEYPYYKVLQGDDNYLSGGCYASATTIPDFIVLLPSGIMISRDMDSEDAFGNERDPLSCQDPKIPIYHFAKVTWSQLYITLVNFLFADILQKLRLFILINNNGRDRWALTTV